MSLAEKFLEYLPETPMSQRLQPMLLTPARPGFRLDQPGWVYEPKLDGFRTITELKDGRVLMYSRRMNILDYPLISRLFEGFGQDAIFDGELVVLKDGKPDRKMLQSREAVLGSTNLYYYIFDLLYLKKRDLRLLPLIFRKQLLEENLPELTQIRQVVYFEDGIELARVVIDWGLEGVVAKRKESLYRSGKRTRNWIKIKL